MNKVQIFTSLQVDDYLSWLRHNSISLDWWFNSRYIASDAAHQGVDFEIYTCKEGEKYFIYPYLLKPLSQWGLNGKFDVIAPYGYSGPVTNDKVFAALCERDLLEYFELKGIVSEFIRYHYYSGTQFLFQQNCQNLVNRKIFITDLSKDWEDIWINQFSSKNRNLFRKIEKDGFEFKVDHDLSKLNEFVTLYNKTMNYKKANSYYYFGSDFYAALQGQSDQLFLAKVLKDGVCYSCSLFTVNGIYSNYFLSARNLMLGNIPTTNFLVSSIIQWIKQSFPKVRMFNLGGGNSNSETDPLYLFKKHLAKTTKDFLIGKRIIDNDSYLKIKEKWINKNSLNEYDKVKKVLQFYH